MKKPAVGRQGCRNKGAIAVWTLSNREQSPAALSKRRGREIRFAPLHWQRRRREPEGSTLGWQGGTGGRRLGRRTITRHRGHKIFFVRIYRSRSVTVGEVLAQLPELLTSPRSKPALLIAAFIALTQTLSRYPAALRGQQVSLNAPATTGG